MMKLARLAPHSLLHRLAVGLLEIEKEVSSIQDVAG